MTFTSYYSGPWDFSFGQLVGTEITKASLGGDLVFEYTGGIKLRGRNPKFHLQADGNQPL